jgi:ADP-heptose:LPS heptosyltransferase
MATAAAASACPRPLIVRCGAFGDMVLLTPLIRDLQARFGCPVDIVTSGRWSEPLLRGQPGVGEIWSVRSRKAPYWLSADQRRVVRHLRLRGAGPTWFCDGNDAARSLLTRAGIPEDDIVDVKDHPLLPGEHATAQWRRLARVMPSGYVVPPAAERPPDLDGCLLEVSAAQQADLDTWLQARGIAPRPYIAVQVGNKRTMRRGLRRLAVNHKFWPQERWAEVLKFLREDCPRHAILLLGTGPEFALNAELARLAGIEGLCNVADDLPIPRLVALLARAAALVGVDSGPAHAAAAVGCPQIVLFGKASPTLYRPCGAAGADVKLLTGQIDGEPDMRGIEMAAVIEAWAGLRIRGLR